MERYSQLLLDVWREACRHIEIAEAIERLTPLLTRHLPLDLLLLRLVEVDRSAIESVASAARDGHPAELPVRSECAAEQLKGILSWCRRGGILRQHAEDVRERLPGLAPEGLNGELLLAPMLTSQGTTGVLILAAQKSRHHFRTEHEKLLEVLLEPFTVALENDRRLRELITLREKVEAENRSLLTRLGRNDISDAVVGADSGLKAVMDRVSLVAKADIPVLILGETGSGKEVIARSIHRQSQRGEGPFLRVNCGAIAPELVDSELFGHEKGSFTGATGQRKGWFERADGGTLFLDECGELTPAAQVRLLRILQEGSFERVGGERQVHVDVRVVAATHRDLQLMIADGTFREDLWYRLAVFPIRLPGLRERTEDIPAMALHFASRAAKRFGLQACAPTQEDLSMLISYPWPGNVRELASVIDRAAVLGDGKRLDVATALGIAPPRGFAAPAPPPPVASSGKEFPTLDRAMAEHIVAALKRTHGQVEGRHGAASLLVINPHTLRARMRKLGVRWQDYRTDVTRTT